MFNNARLLDCVAYGSEFGQEFNTRITPLRSGVERRNANWSAPLGRYSVIYAALKPEDHAAVYNAHMSCMGSLIPFRFKDWRDFSADQEVIGTGTGSPQTLQLIKTYAFGSIDFMRKITRPVTAALFADGSPLAATVDIDSGLVTTTAPDGAVVTWSGEFDVPVRFDDDRLDVEPLARAAGGFFLSANVSLTEVRE